MQALKISCICMLLAAGMICNAQTPTVNSKYNKYTGTNWFTKTVNVNGQNLTNTKIAAWDQGITDTIPVQDVAPLLTDSTVTYVTPHSMAAYMTAHPSAGSAIGFANYDSLSTDSAYFNQLTHKLRVRHGGWWYGFTPSDSLEIYVAPEQDPLGPELCLDPGFDNASLWNAVPSFAISTSKLRITATPDGYLTDMDALTFLAAHTYRVTYTIESITSGWVAMTLGGAGLGTQRTAAGTYTEDILTVGADDLYMYSGGAPNIVIDNISVKLIEGSGSTLLSGLAQYYQLDETSGDGVDEVNAKNLTYIEATQNQSGKIGTSYSFSSQYCRTAIDSTGLNNANYYSASMWIYSSATTGYQSLLCRDLDGSNNKQYWFGLIAGNKLSFATDDSGDKDQTGTFTRNTWVHVGFTFDAVNDSINLYVNGVPVDHFGGSALSAMNSLTTCLRLGGDGSNNFAGSIDEVGIWHRKLSAAEMLEIYNSGTGITYPF